jgi:predicted DNA-binding transcriptional regulator AlpA
MQTYSFTLAFDGVDPWDDDLIEALAEHLPRVHWGEVDAEVQATAFAEASTGVHAVLDVVEAVRRVHATAHPTRVVEDLVSIPDIAGRTGMNRETVRLWTVGARGPGDFPRPRGTVGSGIKIWDWAPVNAWLRRHYELGDAEQPLSAGEAAHLNDIFAAPDEHGRIASTTTRVSVTHARAGWCHGKPVRLVGTGGRRYMAAA